MSNCSPATKSVFGNGQIVPTEVREPVVLPQQFPACLHNPTPSGQAKLWHGKRQPADPVPPRTLKQWLMPWTRPPLTPEQIWERKLLD